jgi:hypothetical protein
MKVTYQVGQSSSRLQSDHGHNISTSCTTISGWFPGGWVIANVPVLYGYRRCCLWVSAASIDYNGGPLQVIIVGSELSVEA